MGRAREGASATLEAMAVYKTLKESTPPGSAGDRLALAESFRSFASFLDDIGEHDEAQRAAGKTIEIYESLMTDFPKVPDYPSALGVLVHNMPDRLIPGAKSTDRFERAIRYQRSALQMAPGNPLYRAHLSNHYLGLSGALMRRGEDAKAKEAYDQAIAIKQKLAADFPDDVQNRELVAQGKFAFAKDLVWIGRPHEAEEPARQAMELYEKLAAESPAAPAIRESLANCHVLISSLAARTGRNQETLQGFRCAIELSPKTPSPTAVWRGCSPLALTQSSMIRRRRWSMPREPSSWPGTMGRTGTFWAWPTTVRAIGKPP